jgi:hypothetical protein
MEKAVEAFHPSNKFSPPYYKRNLAESQHQDAKENHLSRNSREIYFAYTTNPFLSSSIILPKANIQTVWLI